LLSKNKKIALTIKGKG